MIRYAEFHKIEKNQISETALFIDLLHLMAQVRAEPDYETDRGTSHTARPTNA